MKQTLRIAGLLLFAAFAAGCVGYPHVFLAGRRGQVSMADGVPTIKIVIVKNCQDKAENYQVTGKSTQTTPDAIGHYKITLATWVWDWYNFIDGSYCQSHVQLYSCLPECKEMDSEESAP